MTTVILATCPRSNRISGFTLLEMVVVMVMLGIVSSLAIPGIQRMYNSVSRELERNELHSILDSLALTVQHSGRQLVFNAYPAQADELPGDISARLEELGISLTALSPILISASGFCPEGGRVEVRQSLVEYTLTLRSPDCRVVDGAGQ